jgi:hypothetical protein
MPFTHATRVQIPSGSFGRLRARLDEIVALREQSLVGLGRGALGTQGLEMSGNRTRKYGNVVSSLQNADNPTRCMCLCHGNDRLGQNLEILDL